MNAIVQVRQIAQYPRVEAVEEGWTALLQAGEAGTPYVSILARDLVAAALADGGRLLLDAATGGIIFGPPNIILNAVSGQFVFSAPVAAPMVKASFIDAPSITVNGVNVATSADLAANRAASVTSFNFRTGDVLLEEDDIKRAGGAPVRDAHFGGWITAPSVWDTRANDDTVATANWVHRAIHDFGVSSFNGRTGCVTLTTADVNAAYATLDGTYPAAPNPALGDASGRIATTLFVDESLADLHLTISNEQMALLTSTYAPVNSPQFTGTPTAPTANPGSNTGQLATTAFVHAAVTASTTGVASFNTRTGAVTLLNTDISVAGGALTVSPGFTGTPTAPTAVPGTSTTQIASTAFVTAAITAAGGVTSFNTRTGAVSLSLADVTGTGVLASTPLTGTPTAPTAATATNTTQVATTAFVQAVLATGVTSFMGRTGAVTLLGVDVSAAGGALINSPTFTGTPAAPTAVPGTNTTQLATTAFVTAAITAGTSGVTTFNGRAGAVTLLAADITGAGGALTAGPAFTGVPSAPTATVGTSTTQLATTAFVAAALATGVTSFNTRTGAVTLSGADITGAGGALLASPTFTGVPAAPTPAAGTNTTQLATTAFVAGVAAPITAANGSFVFATMSANYSIVNTTANTLPFDTVVFDTNSEYTTASRVFTAKRAGYYRATLLISMSVTTAGAITYAQIWKNGANYAYGSNIGNVLSGNSSGIMMMVNTIVHLAVGDTLSPIGQVSAQPATVYGGSSLTSQFQVQLLALG